MTILDAVVAAAEQYIEAQIQSATAVLTQERDQALLELAQARRRVANLEAMVDGLQQRVAELVAQVANLESRLERCEGGEPAGQFVVYGTSRKADPDETIPNKHRRYAAMLPDVPSYRKYSQGLKPVQEDTDLRHLAANEPTCNRWVVSFKGGGSRVIGSSSKTVPTRAEVEAFAPSIPPHVEVLLCWWHEPVDNWPVAQRAIWREEYSKLVEHVRELNHPRLKLCMILNGWEVAQWRDFYVPGLDYFGFDRYNPTRSGRYQSVEELFDPLWAAYLQTDAKGFIIGETGCDVLFPSQPELAANWARDVVSYFNEKASQVHGSQREAIHIQWWDSIGMPPNYIITDTRLKLQPLTLGVWKAAVAQSAAALRE